MRLLFTTNAGLGHFHPLVPLAQAAQHAGHEVGFACARALCPKVEALGFRAFPAGRHDMSDPDLHEIFARMSTSSPAERERLMAANIFAGVNARLMAHDLVVLFRTWLPDVVVRETLEFGGCIAAEHQGIPHAAVEVTNYPAHSIHAQAISEEMDRIRRHWGLPSDPTLTALYRYLYLTFEPPSFHRPALQLPATIHYLRSAIFDRSGTEDLPAWVQQLSSAPRVYSTLGTEVTHAVPDLAGRIIQAIIIGLREEPLNLIMTLGRDQDPQALGALPANVHIERYIPQTLLLPQCQLVISHGGHNTVLAALYQGVPQVIIPIFADQPENGQCCQRLGVGRMIEPFALTPEGLRAVVQDVLGDPAYHIQAQRIRAEIEALPGLEYGITLLETLVGKQ